jgi:hypothetical protein
MKCNITILLGILLLLSACQIEKPSLPIWDVDLQIPLINERYYVSDLADSVHLIVGDNDLLYLTAEGDMDTPALGQITVHPNVSENDVPLYSGIEVEQTLPFTDDQNPVGLTYGLVATGQIRIRISDVHPDAGEWNINLSIPDITSMDGLPLQLNYTQPTGWQVISLIGYQFGILDNDTLLDELTVVLSTASELPPGETLAALSIEMNTPLSFSVFQGYLNNYEIPAHGTASAIDIEYPNNVDDTITLHDASIQIQVYNEMGFSCEFVGMFQATREDSVVTIPIVDGNGNNYRIAAATDTDATTLEFDSRITELMQIMPDSIEIIESKFIIDTASGYGTIRETDIIATHYTVFVPFRFTLHDHPITIKSPTRISISEENRDRIQNNIQEAGLGLQFLNTIPIGATALAYFADHEEINPDDPDTYSYVKQMTIGSSQSSPDWQELEPLSLNRTELDLFTAEEIFLKWVFYFEESDGLVEIHAGPEDYIWIKGQILATLRVEDM